MVSLTVQQAEDMRVVEQDLITWTRLYPQASYSITRLRAIIISSRFPSLVNFVWSDSWIKRMRRLAGVGKRPRRTILRDHSLLKWMDARKRHGVQTLTSDVRAWWVRKEGRIPSSGTLRAFRERNYIWMSVNLLSGREEAWNLPLGRR